MLPPQNPPVSPDTPSSLKISSKIATAATFFEKGSVIFIIIIFGVFSRDLTTITIFTDSHICTGKKRNIMDILHIGFTSMIVLLK